MSRVPGTIAYAACAGTALAFLGASLLTALALPLGFHEMNPLMAWAFQRGPDWVVLIVLAVTLVSTGVGTFARFLWDEYLESTWGGDLPLFLFFLCLGSLILGLHIADLGWDAYQMWIHGLL